MFSWIYYLSLEDHVDGWLGGALLNDGHLHQVVHLHAAPQLGHRLHLKRGIYENQKWPRIKLLYLLIDRWQNVQLARAVDPDPDSMGSLDPYPDPDSQSGSGSRRAKMAHKLRKKSINYIYWSAGCSLLRAEGFSCSLDISKLQFFKSVFIFFSFWSSKPWTRIGSGYGSGFTWNAGSGFVSGPGFNDPDP